MMKRRFALALSAIGLFAAWLSPRRTVAAPTGSAHDFTFDSIDGGVLDLASWRGRPVLVVNTASLCGFTPQLEGLQKLHEDYAGRGLAVLAVPSDDFAQELDDAQKVKEFCTIQYGITLPMADITPVLGSGAHPFYRWLRETRGFVPKWNFNKVLLDGRGQVVETWGATTAPQSDRVLSAIQPLLTA